jgi:hypothetical protein
VAVPRDSVPLNDELAHPEDKLAWNFQKQVCNDQGTLNGGKSRVRMTPSNTTKSVKRNLCRERKLGSLEIQG